MVDSLWQGALPATSRGPAHGHQSSPAPNGPFARRTRFVLDQIAKGLWRESTIPASLTGLSRDMPIFLAARKTNPVVHDWRGDHQTYCPPLYWDLAIGSGACGLGCRGCYLLGTFRDRRDPHQPVVYDNMAFHWAMVRRWLRHPSRRPHHSLGLGADRSDSLLFEGLLGHARQLIPMFADPRRNPRGAKLFLLTKTSNVHYLADLPTANVMVTFSLNPQPIADLWEGRWPDTNERIAPRIDDRLAASRKAQAMGFEVRWRIDPILTPEGWQDHYADFFAKAARAGHQPSRITLGTYRESTPQLQRWRDYWRVPPMGWSPAPLRRDGTHWHIPPAERARTYRFVADLCQRDFPASVVSLCKETKQVRIASGLCSPSCNCLADVPQAASGKLQPPRTLVNLPDIQP